MSDTIGRIIKRAALPVQCESGLCHACEMTGRERLRANAIESNDLRGAFVVGMALVNASGEKAYTAVEGENDEAFAARVLEDIPDFPPRLLDAFFARLIAMNRTVPVEELAKN